MFRRLRIHRLMHGVVERGRRSMRVILKWKVAITPRKAGPRSTFLHMVSQPHSYSHIRFYSYFYFYIYGSPSQSHLSEIYMSSCDSSISLRMISYKEVTFGEYPFPSSNFSHIHSSRLIIPVSELSLLLFLDDYIARVLGFSSFERLRGVLFRRLSWSWTVVWTSHCPGHSLRFHTFVG